VKKEERRGGGRGASFGEAKRRRDCCIDKVSVRRKENQMTRKKGKGIKEKKKTSTTKTGATPLLGFTSAESSPKVPHSRDLLIQLGSSKRGIPGAWNRASEIQC
jgi:hypothetical protein